MDQVECNLDEMKKGMVMDLDEIRSRTYFIITLGLFVLENHYDKIDKTRRNGVIINI